MATVMLRVVGLWMLQLAGAMAHVPGGRAKRFLPFSDGLRSCVGQSLATTNLTATLATLLGRFRFSLADEVRQRVVYLTKCCQ